MSHGVPHVQTSSVIEVTKSLLPLTDPRNAVPQAHRVTDGQCDKQVTENVSSLRH